jgi:type IV secretion system protein VirB10
VLETGIGAQTGQQATQILDRALNVLPTVTVYEGTRVRIWSAQDFTLPAYENHAVNPAL